MFWLALLGVVAWIVGGGIVAVIFGQAIHHHMNATAHEIPEGE